MRKYRFVTLDVFTDTRFGGNPLAVFPDARGMSDAEMQALAAEFNLSETTFVLPPERAENTARVRIFTPKVEMPFAGHPNVGTGYVIASERGGDLLRFEEIAGRVEIRIARDAAGAVTQADIAAPQPLSLGAEFTPVQLAPCAGLEPWEVVTENHRPVVASVGNPFVLMEVTPDALTRAAPADAEFQRVMAAMPQVAKRLAIYLYARDGAALRARMFGGGLGVKEDAATGSAAVALAATLLHLSGADRGAWDIVQGVEMGRPSLLRSTAHRAADGIRSTVGGGCVKVMEGEAFL
ncbi:PhzF family phenazine biosynthesis protein [Falsiroseomonas bella]|uniref:PhzF family phenazine biosynthesis protein n=1 Tax=Falsiroseomonas bella TaxID=2184016 RepID=A0A317FFJ7_9PROT|nr:PhzF family phenazine biosynthesis protein [Falsiroseomonas bella]PWS36719.1 PhzF family phenazine biosynthesis protein [Falsiroseomonas bella]